VCGAARVGAAAGAAQGVRYNAGRRDAGGRGAPGPADPATMTMDTAPRSNEALRVMHVASGDLWAGAEVQVHDLSRALAALPDIRLHVVVLNEGELARRLRQDGIDTTVLDESRLSAVAVFKGLCALMRRVRPDVVHTHRRKENVLGSLAAARVGARSLRTVHGADEWAPGPLQIARRLYMALDRLTGRFVQDRVVAVSAPLGERLKGRFPAAKVALVENGIDVDDVRRRAAAEVDLPGPAEAVRVAFVGRLVPVKRLDLFLEAAARVTAVRPGRAHFYVFGDGPLTDDVAARRNALGLEGSVTRMGFVPDLPKYLARMDLMLIPSDHEGLPMNLLEALALRVPVAAHAVGGMVDVLDGGRAGMLIDDHRAEGYAAAVVALIDDPAPFRVRAEAGAERVAAHYGAAAAAARYRELYRALAPGRRTAPAAERLAG